MKRYFIMLAAALFAIGCEKDNTEVILTPSSNSVGALTIYVGEDITRGSFDDDLKWSWAEDEVIVGYQNAGSKTRNRLYLVEGNKFSCANFVYYSDWPLQRFHFFYPPAAEYVRDGKKVLEAWQDGTWHPILVGSTEETILQEIGSVEMKHLTSALEIRAAEDYKIKDIKLSSEYNDFVGRWSVNDDLTYTQTFSGKEIIFPSEVNNRLKSVVVFNMPVMSASQVYQKNITLSFTVRNSRNGQVSTEKLRLPAIPLEAGKRTIINLRPEKTVFDDWYEIKVAFRDNDQLRSVKFITESNVTDGKKVQATTGGPYAYLVENGSVLEIHTMSRKFDAQTVCHNAFYTPEEDNHNISKNLQSIDFGNFDTSSTREMDRMFENCKALETINFGKYFKTVFVEDMSRMFYNCNKLTSLDLSGFSFRRQNLNYTDIFTNLGSGLTAPAQTTIWVSDDNKSWFEGKSFDNSNYIIKNISERPQ